jgi:hypothetical protein
MGNRREGRIRENRRKVVRETQAEEGDRNPILEVLHFIRR